MKKQVRFFWLGLISMTYMGTVSNNLKHKQKTSKIKNEIDTLYQNISGFRVDNTEYETIRKKGGFPTYGEITYEGLETLLKELHISQHDVFYDLGCGVGKVCVQVALTTPARKIVGIELSPTRIQHAQNVKKQLHANNRIKNKQLTFLEGNISKASLNNATIVFMCSTCFSDELIHTIINNLAAHTKPKLRIASLRSFPENPHFTLVKKLHLRMTWSDKVAVHIYQPTTKHTAHMNT